MSENKFTPRAEEALRLSQEAAEELGHGYVGSARRTAWRTACCPSSA